MPRAKRVKDNTGDEFIGCLVRQLPAHQRHDAARTAIEHNPANRPLAGLAPLALDLLLGDGKAADLVEKASAGVMAPEFIAVLTTKYWGTKGVQLGVRFLENTAAELQQKILDHMNAWSQWANVRFSPSTAAAAGAEVRVSRGGDGYWSYLGTDVLHVPGSEPTMNLQGFVLKTPDSEYRRVVRHETGHTLGAPHEHMRAEIIDRLDRDKTITYFQQSQGWDAQTTTEQVLTPVSESSLIGATPHAEEDSIMTYQLPGAITKDGRPIVGGTDITADDGAYIGKLYPRAVTPPDPPPTGSGSGKITVTLTFDGSVSNVKAAVA